MTIGQLSDELNISEATISRFARHVGCCDFKRLKRIIMEQTVQKGPAQKLKNTLQSSADNLLNDWIEQQPVSYTHLERAILIVKEGFRDEDPERLRQKAGDYVSHMGNVALARRKKVKFLRNLGKVLAGAAVGVAFMLIVICLLYTSYRSSRS